ncbi:hypothetical protein F4777DRAFT_36710 [Nemania sp. FL0916]|nr:hypothetical protein F4777DRAFT_36710 [Nemania sp. FL0916]
MRYEILRGCWLTLREESYSAADHKCLKTFLHDHPDLSPNEIGYEGMAPLHIAVVHGMVDCAELLLSRGASMEIRTATESGELAGLDPLELFSKIRAESSGSSIGNLDPTRYYSWRTQWYMYEVFEFNTIVEDDSYGTINTLGKADGAVYASKSWNLQKAQKSFDLDMRKPFWVNVTATNVRQWNSHSRSLHHANGFRVLFLRYLLPDKYLAAQGKKKLMLDRRSQDPSRNISKAENPIHQYIYQTLSVVGGGYLPLHL